MKTVKETMDFFIKALQEEVELEFNMQHWYKNQDGSVVNSPYHTTCGTVACLAGTVAAKIDPTSHNHCIDIIQDWTGLEYHNTLALEFMFTDPKCYDNEDLEDVTKEQVINKLTEWSHASSWENLRKELRLLCQA